MTILIQNTRIVAMLGIWKISNIQIYHPIFHQYQLRNQSVVLHKVCIFLFSNWSVTDNVTIELYCNFFVDYKVDLNLIANTATILNYRFTDHNGHLLNRMLPHWVAKQILHWQTGPIITSFTDIFLKGWAGNCHNITFLKKWNILISYIDTCIYIYMK